MERAEWGTEVRPPVIQLQQPADSMQGSIRKGASCPGLNNRKSYSPRAVTDNWGTDGVYAPLGILEQGDIPRRTSGNSSAGWRGSGGRSPEGWPCWPGVCWLQADPPYTSGLSLFQQGQSWESGQPFIRLLCTKQDAKILCMHCLI